MLSNTTKLLVAGIAILASALSLLGLNQVFASGERKTDEELLLSHPVSPGTPIPTPPSRYSLPFDRNQNAVVTNGPGEGTSHIGKSIEAIDFSPKSYGWTEIQAMKPGTVYIRDNFLNWGNLVVIRSDQNHPDPYYHYYAHLADPPIQWLPGNVLYDRQKVGIVGDTGCVKPCVHIHSELRDLMQNSVPSSGYSTNHPIRRLRGLGWYPWYADPDMNSGFVPKSVSHPISVCLNEETLLMRWPALAEYDHFDNSSGTDQIDGYSWSFSTNPNDVPDMVEDGNHGTFTTVTVLPVTATKTKWYFHLRARGIASGWAVNEEVAHQGPYVVKTTCKCCPDSNDWKDIWRADDED